MYDSPFTGLFSGLGRTVTGMLKDVPNDQLGARAFELAKSGLVSFDKALAIKYLADRITKSGSMQGPPPGNVMGDLQMKIRSAITGQPAPQQMPPQGAMPPGMPPPGAMPPGASPPGAMPPPPPPAMMNAGLATLPAPALEGPPPGAPGMAAGGIVAFQEGGLNNPYMQEVEPDYDAYGVRVPGAAAEVKSEEPAISLKDLLSISRTSAEPSSDYMDFYKRYVENLEAEAGRKPGTLEQFTAEERARREKSGYGQALKDRAAAIEGRGSKLEEELAKKTKLGKAAAGFKMAQAASQPGATFLGSLAEGLAGYAQTKGDLEDRMQARRDALEEQKFALAQAREDAQARGDERAEARLDRELARIGSAQERLADAMFKGKTLEIQGREVDARMAQTSGMRPPTTELERLNRLHTAALEEVNNTRPGTKERAAAEAKLASIKEAAQYARESQAGYQTGMAGTAARLGIAAADSIEKNTFLIRQALRGNTEAQKQIAAIAKQLNMTYEEYVGAAKTQATSSTDSAPVRWDSM